jgi:hypothetical protein
MNLIPVGSVHYERPIREIGDTLFHPSSLRSLDPGKSRGSSLAANRKKAQPH